MAKKINKDIYFKFFKVINFSNDSFKSKVIDTRNMPKDYRRTVFRKKRRKRYYNLLNYGYSEYIGILLKLKCYYKKEKRLLKKVSFEEEWLNILASSSDEMDIYLIESLTKVINLKEKDTYFNDYVKDLEEDIEKCPSITTEQKLYLKEKYVKYKK